MVGLEKEQVSHSAGLGVSGFQGRRQPRRDRRDAAGAGPGVPRPRRGSGSRLSLREEDTAVPKVSPGRAGLSSHPVGLTRVLALPFLFRFSELDP